MNKQFGIIYKATNVINGKCYIGQTTNKFYYRIAQHKHAAIKKKNKNYFHNAIRKYGWENFKWEILCECDMFILGIRETMKIIVEHAHCTENGYNLTWGGDSDGSSKGQRHNLTKEQRQLMGSGNRGVPRTDEVKQKISNSMKGIIRTEEHRKKLIESHTGFKHSDETKRKISSAGKGRICSEKTRLKMSEAHKKENCIGGYKK